MLAGQLDGANMASLPAMFGQFPMLSVQLAGTIWPVCRRCMTTRRCQPASMPALSGKLIDATRPVSNAGRPVSSSSAQSTAQKYQGRVWARPKATTLYLKPPEANSIVLLYDRRAWALFGRRSSNWVTLPKAASSPGGCRHQAA
eukprot:6986626-Alexandrium_andersonii.AAC.1